MINIEIRDKNRIVTLSTPLKTPIHSRNGSPYFYNPLELVCVAVGSCFGRELIQFCTETNLSPRVFESIMVTMENFISKIILSHPSDFKPEQLTNIARIARNCPVAKLLNNGVEIEFVVNTTSTKHLVDESKDSNCCGGGLVSRP